MLPEEERTLLDALAEAEEDAARLSDQALRRELRISRDQAPREASRADLIEQVSRRWIGVEERPVPPMRSAL